MTRSRLAVAVCLAATAFTTGSAGAQDIDFTVGPTLVVEGGTLTVDVTAAPQTPVTVEIYVDGKIYHSETLTSIPGEVSVVLPENSAGERWEVNVFSGDEVDTDWGTIAPAGGDGNHQIASTRRGESHLMLHSSKLNSRG